MDNQERELKAGIISHHIVAQWDDETFNKLWDKVSDEMDEEAREKREAYD